MTIRRTIIEAKLFRQRVTIQTDEGETLTGATVEAFEHESVTLGHDSGVMFIRIREIEAVTYE